MKKFKLDMIKDENLDELVEIYNSNKDFLLSHLGKEKIEEKFLINEIISMRKIGFESKLIRDKNNKILGAVDFRGGKEIYLSLIIINRNLRGRGLGKEIYKELEDEFIELGAEKIRIDVVYNYKENLIEYWERQGFKKVKEIELEWSGFKSKAFSMEKNWG